MYNPEMENTTNHEIGIGSRVKIIREQLGMSQPELAQKCNSSVSSLSEIEANMIKPGFDFISSLGYSFDVNLDYLFYGHGKPFKEKESGIDTLFKGIDLGEATPLFLEMIYRMKYSKMFFHGLYLYSQEYFIKNKRLIENEIEANRKNEGSDTRRETR